MTIANDKFARDFKFGSKFKNMENVYSSRDFLIIILDASKLAQLVFYSLKIFGFF